MAERRRPGYSIYREILDEEAVDVIAQKSESKTSLCEKVKKSVRCSGPRAKRCLLETIPILSWLPRYPIRENALGDLISGISVGVMHLPQGMAYALLASVSPVFGLYSSFYPILVYFIFGTSKHISIGTYAVMSVMIGGVTERLAPDSDFMNWDNVTNSSIIDTVSRDAQRVKVAAAVTFMSGLFQILLGLVKFGFVVTYLSEPLVRGYTTAAAIHVIVSQLKYTFGINPKRHSGPFSLIYTILEVCYLVPQTNIGTLVVSIVTIICLILAKELNAYLQKKLPVPIPVELIAIIIATVVSWQVNLEQKYGVDIVGVIPSGLQAPVFPEASLFGQVIGDAFALSVVGYGILISLGRIFALKYGYRVDSNQELIALGLSNSIGGIFQCFAISCSMSRTMVQESTGGKTQVAGALSAVVILFITLWIGSLFEDLPKAVLAAIIYVNLHGMMKQFMDIPALWKKNRVDMLVWVGTLILTILFNPDMGLAASIGYMNPHTYNFALKMTQQVPGIFIFRSSATIYFANAEMYQDALGKKVKTQTYAFIFFFFSISCLLHSPLCLPTGFNTRLCLHIHYSAVSVSVSLSLAGVVDNLQSSGFFNDKVTKSCLFTTIHDAVLFCQSTRTDCQDKVTYCLSSQTCTSTHIVHHRAFCCESGRNLSC
uniref:SLC26A/SulP transporter domain-containing protein n=1 Tax=Anabas testudineus TaxID=64144 RepID=A0A7N6AMR6_ANATE